MASSAISPVLRAPSTDSGSSATPTPDSYPVPPDRIITAAEENRRHILSLLEQGECDITAGRTADAADVQRRMRERIAARRAPASSR